MGRQWTALALAGVLAVTLTACGSDKNMTDTSSTGSMAGQAGYARTGRAGYANRGRVTNDYMEDARYRAGSDGKVDGKDSTTSRDLTQDARDMLRDAGDAARDVGRGVENAAKDIMNQ